MKYLKNGLTVKVRVFPYRRFDVEVYYKGEPFYYKGEWEFIQLNEEGLDKLMKELEDAI